MFKKLFGKKESIQNVEVKAPLTGTAITLEEVPDPVFAEKMMGDGLAIDPTEGSVVSPVNGEIIQVFPTKHAIGIRAENGAEILIHIGLETVSMKGEGFETHVSEGSSVKEGQQLVTFDLDLVKEKAKSTITPVIITNGDQVSISKSGMGPVQKGNTAIMSLSKK